MGRILVTGASGNVGSRIVRMLAARDIPVRALVRRRDRVAFAAPVEIVEGNYEDLASLRRALSGVDRLYLIAAGPDLTRHDASVIDAAEEANVEHIVKLSVAGAPSEASPIPTWHRAGEKRLEASGRAWTFLRPASFASNALGWAGPIRARATVFGALGETALPVIDPDDIAAVSVHVLTTPGHAGKAYTLTGPEALTTARQVEVLSEVLDKRLTYVNVPDEAAQKGMIDGGMPKAWAEALIGLIQQLRALGRVEPTTAVRELIEREPRTFRAWAEANVAAFR